MKKKLWIALLVWLTGHVASARRQGPTTACKSNLKNIATACEMYASDHGGRYPVRLCLLIPGNYLRSLPTCPSAGYDTYSPSYRSLREPDLFGVCCVGHHHKRAGLPRNYPAYDAEQGLLDSPATRDHGPGECLVGLRRVGTALTHYRETKGCYPTRLDQLAIDLPVCPNGPFVYGQRLGRPQVSCPSWSHLPSGYAPLQPAWSESGLTQARLPLPPRDSWEEQRDYRESSAKAILAGLAATGLATVLIASRRRRRRAEPEIDLELYRR